MIATYYILGNMPNYSSERELWRYAKGELQYWRDFEINVESLDPYDLQSCSVALKNALSNSPECTGTARSIIQNPTVLEYSEKYKRLMIRGENCIGVYIDL